MSNKETQDQIKALAMWFQSQQIHPKQSIVVMIILMLTVIRDLAHKNGFDPMEGCEAIYRDMKAAFQKTKSPKPMRHFLFSIMIENGVWMHSYVMCDDTFDEKVCAHEMLDIMQDKGIQPAVPIMAATKLTDDKTINRVRDMVCAVSPDALAQMAAATDFHRTMWSTDDPKMNEEIATIH